MANPSTKKTSPRSSSRSGATQTGKAGAPTQSGESNSTETGDLVEQLKQQHREVEALLTEPEAEQNLASIVEQIASKWIPHTLIEEEIILPALGQSGADEPTIAEAEVRRDLVKLLLADLQDDPSGPGAAAKFAVLGSEIEQLIEVEERPESGVLALAETHGVDLNTLKPEVDARITQINLNTEGERSHVLEPTSLRLQGFRTNRHGEEYSSMPYGSNTRDRDERGRFESDDDRRGGNRSRGNDRDRDENGRFTSDDDRGYQSRSSRDYDDDYRRSGSNGGGPGRDDHGRFTPGGYSSRSSRYSDDDRRGGYSSRGNDRDRDENGRFMSDDDRSYRGSSRYDDDDRRGGYSSRGNDRDRDENGRFMSDDDGGGRGSSRSSRYDDDDRRGSGGGRGWFGDSQGHSEAAREGWEDRRGGSRSSRDDDDDRRGGGRGHGGWFGDSRGHAEAARRGWDDRR